MLLIFPLDNECALKYKIWMVTWRQVQGNAVPDNSDATLHCPRRWRFSLAFASPTGPYLATVPNQSVIMGQKQAVGPPCGV